MLVVVGVVALVLPAIFSIVLAILRQQSKIFALQEVKRQGDFVLNNMRTVLKNEAVAVYTGIPSDSNLICNQTGSVSTAGATLYFKDKYNNYFWYTSDGTKIASNSSISGVTTTTDLTSGRIRIDPDTPLSVTCFRGASFASPIISVSYGVEFSTASTRPEDNASFDYKTKIKLRSL